MLKAAGLQVYNHFTVWKLNTFTDKEKQLQQRRSRKLHAMYDILEHMYKNHLKAGVNAIAQDSWNTNMLQRILNKLSHVAFGKAKNCFDKWKFTTHQHMLMASEHKKARVLDMLVQHSMSDSHRALLRWSKNARDWKMFRYG